MFKTISLIVLVLAVSYVSCGGGTRSPICVDACKNNPCFNNGTCSTTNCSRDFNCTCGSNYAGQYCQNVIDPCSDNVCKNGATCNLFSLGNTTSRAQFNCSCATGYLGFYCDIPVNPCSVSNICNNGTCNIISNSTVDSRGMVRFGQYNCTCNDGYMGERCQCATSGCPTCTNNGTCGASCMFEGSCSYYCICPRNYYGSTCSNYNSRG